MYQLGFGFSLKLRHIHMREFSSLTVDTVNTVMYLPCPPVSAPEECQFSTKPLSHILLHIYLLASEVTQGMGILETNLDENLYFRLALWTFNMQFIFLNIQELTYQVPSGSQLTLWMRRASREASVMSAHLCRYLKHLPFLKCSHTPKCRWFKQASLKKIGLLLAYLLDSITKSYVAFTEYLQS